MADLRDRIPPHNIEAEQSVIGSMLLDRSAISRAMEVLQRDSFYREAHALIFQAIERLDERGEAVDLVTLSEELRQNGQLEQVGGITYLTKLAESVPTAANVDYYARIVEEKAVLRRLIQAAATVTEKALDEQDDVEHILDQAEQIFFDIGQNRKFSTYQPLGDILIDTFERIEHAYLNKGGVTGVPSGFHELDQMTTGFHPAEFIIVAARPSQGKTALCLNMACHAAIKARVPVGFFSLEMSGDQLAQRILSSEAHVNGHRMRTGHLNNEDWQRLTNALGFLGEAPLYIDDTPNISIFELRAKARRMKAEHNIGILFIDYLQLMHSSGRHENRQQEISTISRSLKALARELDIPVVTLSQLSRAVEQRQDRRPQLSDLRESGAIEQDADLVMFIYHNPDLEPGTNIVELILAKQRNGPVGSIELVFVKEYGKFANLDLHHGEVGA